VRWGGGGGGGGGRGLLPLFRKGSGVNQEKREINKEVGGGEIE